MSKGKDSAAENAVCDYLTKQNRPYSAIDIFNNLHKEYGKTAVVKCLDSMAQEGKIRAKTYGKQTVYVADQSKFPDIPEAEVKAMDVKIQQLTDKLKGAEEKYKKSDVELRSLNSAVTTEEAKKRLSLANSDCEKYETRLGELKANSNAVSPEERQQIMKERTTYVKEWRKRKRMGKEILDAILEGYPKSKKELIEEVGIETDEEYNVKPPEL